MAFFPHTTLLSPPPQFPVHCRAWGEEGSLHQDSYQEPSGLTFRPDSSIGQLQSLDTLMGVDMIIDLTVHLSAESQFHWPVSTPGQNGVLLTLFDVPNGQLQSLDTL